MINPRVVKGLEEKIAQTKGRRFLITVKTGKIVHVNLNILSHFLTTRKKKGMYISIDRPHKYIELLLRKKHVPQDNIYYVDIATKTDVSKGARSILAIGGFLWLKILSNTFDEVYRANSVPAKDIDFYDLDFIIMDNASVLPAYNSLDSIREFFSEFGNIVRDHENIKAFIMTPRDMHARMYETLKNFVDAVMDIPDEWLR